jgi:hypothetical protein
MSHDTLSVPPTEGSRLFSPWVVLGVGLACNALGYLLASSDGVPVLVRLGLLAVGTLLLLIAVVRRLRTTGWDFQQRLASSAMVSLAGLGALFGYGFFLINDEWDSGILFGGGLFILTVVGSVLILLPSMFRRVAISLFLLFHFAGMAVAITSVDPPGGTPPYLPKQLWMRVYRPYLSFIYMTNAYHFYSPDPGPPALLWFAVKYSDGSYTWVKLPARENSPIQMHYQRMLAMPEHSFQPIPRLPLSAYELVVVRSQYPDVKFPERGSWEMIYARRQQGSTPLYRYPNPPPELKDPAPGYPIPMIPDISVPTMAQYREPGDVHKKILAGISRRVLHHAPEVPGATATSVKLYRVVHQILSPRELADDVSPLDKTKFGPYFMGEFDRDGKLIDPKEPFLYWYLPITMVPADYPRIDLDNVLGRPTLPIVFIGLKPKGGFLLDCLEMHAAGQIVDVPKEKN